MTKSSATDIGTCFCPGDLHLTQGQDLTPPRNHDVDVAAFHPLTLEGHAAPCWQRRDDGTPWIPVAVVLERVPDVDLSAVDPPVATISSVGDGDGADGERLLEVQPPPRTGLMCPWVYPETPALRSEEHIRLWDTKTTADI